MNVERWVVFTDLDGTLLDARTYSWEPARDTLHRLHQTAIPVVFCTSKTRAETALLQQQLDVHDPFIVESGGAICDADETVVLGTPYAQLVQRFGQLKTLVPGALCGFSDLTDAEVAQRTGLSVAQAALARQRQYEEPFFFLGDEATCLPPIAAKVAEWGPRLSRGGRFWHLHGPTDKGLAVRRLLERYPQARSIGLGDSALDLPMLEAVDFPVAVARPDGSHDPLLTARLPALHKTQAPGPAGWAEAIAALVS